jgi:tRNA pseudouridine13 synthase
MVEWPYSSEGLAGIGGRLRSQPKDFLVEEVPLYLPADEGQHLYVNLTKEELTTKEVQRKLEELFGLKRDDVGLAGLKDKFARTTQTFSLDIGYRPEGFAEEAAAKIADELPVAVNWARFHKNKLKIGHLLGNRFVVTVTDLDCSVDEAMQRAAAIQEVIDTRGLPNYFGPQRFGPNGSNVKQGFELLSGQRRQRDRWLRKFLISSVQSYVCNRYLAARVAAGLFDQVVLGDVAKKHDTGGIFLVEDVDVEQPRFVAKEISFTAPLVGSKMKQPTDDAAQLEQQVLEEFPDLVGQLAAARVDGNRRMGRLLPDELAIQPLDDGREGLQLAFYLPKGAFATTVLREFMKSDVAAVAALDGDEDE